MSFKKFLEEEINVPHTSFSRKDHDQIGWWKETPNDYHVMYHGTHKNNIPSILKNGINAPNQGSTKGWVSLTHDKFTAHGYASMSGGESHFRSMGQKAVHVPHEDRRILKLHVPKTWAQQNMNHEMRGNIDHTRNKLIDKNEYLKHKAAGGTDHEYYATTELRFKDHVPPHFIVGIQHFNPVTKKPANK